VESTNLFDKIKDFLGFSYENDDMMGSDEHIEEMPQYTNKAHQQQAQQKQMPQQEQQYDDEFTNRRMPRHNSVRNGGKIVELPQNNSFQLIILEPKNLDDAVEVVKLLRSKVGVLVNFVNTSLSETDTMHIIDFICGAVSAIDGNQKIVSPGVYVFASGNIDINSLQSEHQGSLNKSGNNLFLTVDDIVGGRMSRAS